MKKNIRKILAVVLSVAFVLSGMTFITNTVRADYVREYTTVGNGNGWQYMTINANTDNDGPRETFTVEGGTTWDDYPTFTWTGYPLHPMLTPWISPTDTMTAGLYAKNVNEWNVIAYFFKSPVYTVQNTGTHTVSWNAVHNLSVYNTATRYYIQLIDANTGEVLYTNPKCVNCSSGENCEACERYAQYGHNYEFVEKYQCDDTCTCCEDGERNRFNYFGEYVNGDEQPLSFDVDLEAGQQVQILYARNNGSQLTVTEASISEPAVYHNVEIVGDQTYPVEHGKTFTLPQDYPYGYIIDGELYPAGYVLTVTKDITAYPVNKMSISVMNGAAIRTGPPAGIAYHGKIDTIEQLLNSESYTAGMLITCYDNYTGVGEETLDLNSTYDVVNVVNEGGWLENKIGHYRAGVINVPERNYTRNYIARAYVTLNYKDKTSRTFYSGMSDVRNIKQVANSVLIGGKEEEKTDFVRMLAAYED